MGRFRRLALSAAMVAAAFGSGVGSAMAVDDPVGVWTFSASGAQRQCRVQLRGEATASGNRVLAVPPGCRHAFPLLAGMQGWSLSDDGRLAFTDEAGTPVLLFAEAGDGRLTASGPEGGPDYSLVPAGSRKAPVAPATAASASRLAAAQATEPAPYLPPRAPVTAAAVSGHYAVMRGSRDTGCMVTLDETASGTGLKARLAPACRDQGIIVFDPIGWSLKSNHLVLAARRGHTAEFSRDEAGIWVKDAATGQPLGLKRL